MLPQKQKLLPVLLMGTGAVLIGIALAADYHSVSIASEGFGPKQLLLALSGLAIFASGAGLGTPFGQRLAARIVRMPASGPPASPLRAGDVLMLATWFGLVTGLAEVAVWAVRKQFQTRINPTQVISPHIVWMAPITDMVLFVTVGLLMYAATRFWPELLSLKSAAFSFAFLSFLGLLLMIPGLHLVAVVVLTSGLAMQTARIIAAHPDRFYALIRYSAGWTGIVTHPPAPPPTPGSQNLLPGRRQFLLSTGAILTGLAVGTRGWEIITEQQAKAQLPAFLPGRPNVLLIVLDTVRAQNLSVYGYHRRTTPNLERLAQNGVRFEQAVPTAPWTLPSHASMFTGRWHHELSADWSSALDGAHPTLAEILRDEGYLTAGFVSNLSFCNASYGLNRGFVHYEDFPISVGQAILSSSLGRELTNDSKLRRLLGYHDVLNRKNAAAVTADFLRWHSKQESRPFFAFLNFYDAHSPCLPPAPFDTKFGPEPLPAEMLYWTNDARRADWWKLSTEQTRLELETYDEAIAYIDHALGRLFDELARRGALDNTLVIVTADHGEQFGEHGLFGHTNSLYLPALHVPLLFSFPAKLPRGLSIAEAVTLRNLPATVSDVIGLGNTAPFPGSSLAQHWHTASRTDWPGASPLLSEINGGGFSYLEWEPVVKGDMKSLILGRYHFIRNGDGQEELYDWKSDPAEEINRAHSDESRPIIGEFRAYLDRMLTSTQSVI